MYRNFSNGALGVSGRQSEIVEMAMTFGYEGLSIDLPDFLRRVELYGLEHTKRFIDSARRFGPLLIGTGELPARWTGNEANYKIDLSKLEQQAEHAVAIGCTRWITWAMPASDEMPYPECFELHRSRLTEMADALKSYGIHIGVGFYADAARRKDREYDHIHRAEELLALISAIPSENVGLLYDSWHWYVGGGTLDQIRELPGNKIVAVRLADIPPDADVAKVEASNRLLPGTEGVINGLEILNLLKEKDFGGPVTPFPHSSKFRGMTRENILMTTAQKFDELWTAAGLTIPEKSLLLYTGEDESFMPEIEGAEGDESDEYTPHERGPIDIVALSNSRVANRS